MFFRYGWRAIRLLTTKSSSKTSWDPVLSLHLNDKSLVLLEKCSSKNQFKQILAQIMRANLIGNTFPMSRLILFSAIMFPENIDIARLLFRRFTPSPNVFIYNTMISAVSCSKMECFGLYISMLNNRVCPDKQTFLNLLKLSSKCLSEVKQIHCHLTVTGLLFFSTYLWNSLVKSYTESGSLGFAGKLFAEMPERDAASYNIMIVGYAKKGFFSEALGLYYRMISNGFEPDDYTLLGLLLCCGHLGDVKQGKSVHGWIERRKPCSSSNLILDNALLDMYFKCRESDLARRAFDTMTEKEIVSWNTMVAGFARLGDMEAAQTNFRRMPERDLVSWNSLISGYAQKSCNQAGARELFQEMVIAENVIPDHVTMLSLISGAAETGELDQGRWIHGLVIRREMKIDAVLGSALIDMYWKCGSFERAFMVFKTFSGKKDVTLWTTMITGCDFHGNGQQALQLFQQMQKQGVMPNKVTLLSVLAACSHSGLVEQGVNIFNTMKEKFGIDPEAEHYGSTVDLLCRSGRLKEAKEIVQMKMMSIKPNESIWGSILSACRVHGDVETAEMALRELLKLEPEKAGGFVLLSNIYAADKRWSYSDQIRDLMENCGVKKIAGYSSLVVGGEVHSFVAADQQNHPRYVEIERILQHLHEEMKLMSDSLELLEEDLIN